MTAAEMRAAKAVATAKAAAPKQGPLIKPARQMTPAERRMNQMDRPTNNMGAEAYKGGGKVGGSKVPFLEKKVMRKAEGGAVSQPQDVRIAPGTLTVSQLPTQMEPSSQPMPMPSLDVMKSYKAKQPMPMPEISDTGSGYVPQPQTAQPAGPSLKSLFGGLDPSLVAHLLSQETATQPAMPASAGMIKPDLYGTSPGPMPTMPNEGPMPSAPKPAFGGFDESSMPDLPQRQFYDYVYTPKNSPEMFAADRARVAAAQADRAATAQAQQEMAAQAQMDQGLGRGLAPRYGQGVAPRFMR